MQEDSARSYHCLIYMQTFDLCTNIFTKVLKGNRTNSICNKFSTIYVHAVAFLGLQNIGKFILILLGIN